MSKLGFWSIGLVALGLLAGLQDASAARPRSSAGYSAPSGRFGSTGQILFDVSAHFIRETQAEGSSGGAARVSLGGMFTSWVGLDLQGTYEQKTQNYLVGADLRLAPVNWFFIKGGVGGYSQKATGELKLAPLGGAGIQAHITSDFYLLTEATYYQVDKRDNLGIGAGLGVVF